MKTEAYQAFTIKVLKMKQQRIWNFLTAQFLIDLGKLYFNVHVVPAEYAPFAAFWDISICWIK